jgi:hypothetical protein
MGQHCLHSLVLTAGFSIVGCHAPGPGHEVPVDCETLTNTVQYCSPETWHFPYSSPPCPYFSRPEAYAAGHAVGYVGPDGGPGGHACTACQSGPLKPPLDDEGLE